MLKERAVEALLKLGFKEGTDRFDMAIMGYMMGWQDRGHYEIERLIERTKKDLKEANQ